MIQPTLNAIALLIPALIPSWRFFDGIAPSPRIEYSLVANRDDQLCVWQELRPRPAHLSWASMLGRLFWNASWNESLFLVSCAERLMARPTEHSHHEILSRLRTDLLRQGQSAPQVQFRLVFISRHGDALQREVTYLSPVHPLHEGAP